MIVGHVVARVRLDRINTEAYTYCFKTIFDLVDWSDQQMKGLENAVGKDVAAKVAKGCRVHFTRSVKRVSERVNKNTPKAQ